MGGEGPSFELSAPKTQNSCKFGRALRGEAALYFSFSIFHPDSTIYESSGDNRSKLLKGSCERDDLQSVFGKGYRLGLNFFLALGPSGQISCMIVVKCGRNGRDGRVARAWRECIGRSGASGKASLRMTPEALIFVRYFTHLITCGDCRIVLLFLRAATGHL